MTNFPLLVTPVTVGILKFMMNTLGLQGLHSHREEFRFRLEKTSEIIKCLNELGINVTEAEILNPEKYKENTHRIIFEQLAELCTGVTREEMAQPVFSGLKALNFPQLHEVKICFLELCLITLSYDCLGKCGEC